MILISVYIILYCIIGLLVVNYFNERNKDKEQNTVLKRLFIFFFWLPFIILYCLYGVLWKGETLL